MVLDSDGQTGRSTTLSDLFTVETHLLSTRSADLYRSLDRVMGEPVSVWVLRHPLLPRSPAAARFMSRLDVLGAIEPPVCKLVSHGIDDGGIAYVALPPLEGGQLTVGPLEPREAERRFSGCLRVVDAVHRAGLVCGDLCESSFWLDRTGSVEFIGLVGSFDVEAAATSVAPPVESLHYVAPEQRGGGGAEPASDVYALGVLLYRLFTGRFPGAGAGGLPGAVVDPAAVAPLASFNPQVPEWTDEVVRRCLAARPSDRYATAGDLAAVVASARSAGAASRTALTVPGLPARTDPPPSVERPSSGSGRAREHLTGRRPEPGEAADEQPRPIPSFREEPPVRLAYLRIGVAAALLSFAVVVGRRVVTGGGGGAQLSPQLASHRSAAGSNRLADAIGLINRGDTSLREKNRSFERLSLSDDPLMHDVLVKSARDAKSDAERALAERALGDRLVRLRMPKTAEQLKAWLSAPTESGTLPAGYEAVLQSLNTLIPPEARVGAVRQAHAASPKVATRLAGAMALDAADPDVYRDALAAVLRPGEGGAGTGRSALALVLADPYLASVFGNEVLARRASLSDPDVLWLLGVLAERGDERVREMASLARDRHVLSPVRERFLAPFLDRTAPVPPEVAAGAARGARGELRDTDVKEFGAWFDLGAEELLLLSSFEAPTAAGRTAAFDALSTKPVSSEPAASFVTWIKENKWDERAAYAPLVGIMANTARLTDSALAAHPEALAKLGSSAKLIRAAVASGDAHVQRLVVTRYPDKLGLAVLLELLKSSDPEVRIASVKELSRYNDVGALKYVLEAYDKEKDPTVAAAYKAAFWVIRQREGEAR